MKINVSFFNHDVDIRPSDVLESLEDDATDQDLLNACRDAIEQIIADNPPTYRADGKEQLANRVLEMLASRIAMSNEEES